jgi:hypothetical protein
MKLSSLINFKQLKELKPTDKKSLMGIGKYDSQSETDFNKHHGGSMYGDFMGNIADTDTTEFDDQNTKTPGKVEPYNPKKDKINRGYEPIDSPYLKEMENPCWKGYEMVGTKTKDGREVPNCVPKSKTYRTQNEETPINPAANQPGGFWGSEETDEDINSDADVNYGNVEPEEYDVDNYDDYLDFIKFMRGYSKELYEATCPCMLEAEYQGRSVPLGKPMRGDVKKFKVYVKNPAGNVVKVNFGHGGTSAAAKGEKTMKIRKSNPKARKSFRARHHCDTPGPRHKARYWSCRKW